MNWEAIGAVGEILGALAVVVSIVYLAAQVKKQATESPLTATRALSRLYNEILDPAFQEKEFSSLYLNAVQNFVNT